jgi:uncharacterized protein (DUF2384 family)
MTVTIERAVEPEEIIQALKRFGVSQLDIAAATQVSDRAVRAWTRAGGIRPAPYTRLTELRDVVLTLRDTLTARGVGQWLHARNRMLDARRPIDVLAAGDYDEVQRAAEAFVDGTYL